MSCENVTLKKGNAFGGGSNLSPGEWGEDEEGRVYVRCKHDSHVDKRQRIGVIYLGLPDPRYWMIDPHGNVTPSIFFNDPHCGWHIYAKLEGWNAPTR